MNNRKHIGTIEIKNLNRIKDAIYAIANTYDSCFIYDSCETNAAFDHKEYELIAGIGRSEQLIPSDSNNLSGLDEFYRKNKDWVFGGLSYDLKNELEDLTSENPDPIRFPNIYFIVPQHVILITADGKKAELHSLIPDDSIMRILSGEISPEPIDQWTQDPKFSSAVEEENYLKIIESIREDIRSGDVYELNYCIQFNASVESSNTSMDLHRRLLKISPVPFAAFARFDQFEVISASPERYLKKKQNRIISQPIKGTAGRSDDPNIDLQNQRSLQNSLKDRAENVMIVDLVRNDLARTCKSGTIQVEELFGIYKFPQVFQMISTISGELRENMTFIDAINNSFPMGSMTGAPKIAAMQLIEHYEDFKRGWYSGSLGYIDPDGDMDFNVLIRSLFVNRDESIISYSVGGAITIDSDPKDEYQECMWKASAIRRLFYQVRDSGN